MSDLLLTFRMLRRDLRTGELTLLAIALLLAVTALSSVGFLADRIEQGLKRDATQLLGGDVLINADHPIPPAFVTKADASGLRHTQTTTFNSMVSTDNAAQLAAVKAVEPGYPLRGSLRIDERGTPREAGRVPASGEAWIDEQLQAALQLKVGDSLELGLLRLRLGAIIQFESDRGMGFSSFAPRIMVNAGDLAASGLIQEGSRARYRLQVAGEPRPVLLYEQWAQAQLGRGETLESLENARPEIRSGMDRASRFLRLSAMLAVVLAAVAIGLSSRRYLHRHFNTCAVMRCFGAQRGQLLRLYLGEFLVLGLAVAALGCVAGYLLQLGLVSLARDLLATDLPSPGFLPVLHGLLVGVVLVLGFVAPQLLKLSNVPPISVLRREWGGLQAVSLSAWGFGALSLTGLMFWLAGDWKLGLTVVGGFAAAILVFVLLAWAALEGLSQLRGLGRHWGARYGLASLRRRRASSMVQIVALGLGVTALFVISLVSEDLLLSWRGSLAPDAPNRFVINIQPPQKAEVERWLQEQGVAAVALQPMIRGRLVSINGRPVSAKDYAEERARNLVEREFNLSWSEHLADGNRIVEGAWHGASPEAVFSMEQGVGRTLGIRLGDTVVFDVGGRQTTGRVGSIRKLAWDSMRVNFFFTAAPGVLDGLPASYITSFYLSPAQTGLVRDLVAAFPNLTVIDVTAVLAQVESVSGKLTHLVQFVSLFALIAGVIVLLAAQRSTHDERAYELTVLRAMGARHRQLRLALGAELLALAVVSVCLAALASQALGYGLARYVFEIDYELRWLRLFAAMAVALLLILGLGWPSAQRAITGTVADGLRERESGAS